MIGPRHVRNIKHNFEFMNKKFADAIYSFSDGGFFAPAQSDWKLFKGSRFACMPAEYDVI